MVPVITRDRDGWRLLDEHCDLWQLTPTGDRHCPLTITLVLRETDCTTTPPNLMDDLKRSLETPTRPANE